MIDVETMLANTSGQSPARCLGAARNVLPRAVALVLVVVVTHQLASLTWALVPGATAAIFPVRASSSVTRATRNHGTLIDSHLFGQMPEQQQAGVAPVTEAPDTTLSVSLTGILSMDGNGNGIAIIKNSRNEELAYYLGETIELADGATLHAVYADRVLLERGGRVEALRLPENLRTAGVAQALVLDPTEPQSLEQNPR